jgi:hypothetical protein
MMSAAMTILLVGLISLGFFAPIPAHAWPLFQIDDVRVSPPDPIHPGDPVSLETTIRTPTSPAFLTQPTDVEVVGNSIFIDVHVSSGPQRAIDELTEVVDLGRFSPGTYPYTVTLIPEFDASFDLEMDVVTGHFTILPKSTDEGVCDELGLEGRAWGLCNAYCEALDCDSPDPKANPKACESLKNHLDGVKEGASRCEVVECPCFTLEDLEQITNATSCNLSVNTMCDGTTFRSDVVSDTTTVGICSPSYPEGSIVTVSGPYENVLGGTKTNPPLPRRKCWPGTLAKLHACMDLVETRCDDLGL